MKKDDTKDNTEDNTEDDLKKEVYISFLRDTAVDRVCSYIGQQLRSMVDKARDSNIDYKYFFGISKTTAELIKFFKTNCKLTHENVEDGFELSKGMIEGQLEMIRKVVAANSMDDAKQVFELIRLRNEFQESIQILCMDEKNYNEVTNFIMGSFLVSIVLDLYSLLVASEEEGFGEAVSMLTSFFLLTKIIDTALKDGIAFDM